MKNIWLAACFCAVAFAADPKPFPGQAGNDNIELRGEAILEPAEIKQEVGSELGMGIVVMRVTASNKTGEALRVGPADFTLVSRKDGDRAEALEPGQLAGGTALIVKKNTAGREWAQQTNTPGWTGISGTKTDKPKDDVLLAALKAKLLPDGDLKPNQSSNGLMYFAIETKKLKSKDLALVYKGPAGHLTMEFK